MRRIDPLPPSELLTMFHQQDPTNELATLVGSIDAASSRDVQVSPFPSHALETINDSCGDLEFSHLLHTYPVAHPKWGNKASRKALEAAWKEIFGTRISENQQKDLTVTTIERNADGNEQRAVVTLQFNKNFGKDTTITVPCGSSRFYDINSPDAYVFTQSAKKCFGSMMNQHQSRDLLLIGATGEGKSAAANYFAKTLGESFSLS